MKKYVLIVVAIVALVVMASGCTSTPNGNNTTTKTYSANGISFNYPSNWDIVTENSTVNGTIVAVGDVDFSKNNGTKGNGVVILKLPVTNNTTSDLNSLKSQFASFNSTNTTITIAGVTANETTLNVSTSNITGQIKFIDFSKNNFEYIIQYTTVASNFQTQSGLFDVITKSLKVT